MNRAQATPYVSFVVDDAGCGRELGADQHAIVRAESVLVGWQCGFEPLFVAVHAYGGWQMSEDEAVELATDFLLERDWFSDGEAVEPDHILGASN